MASAELRFSLGKVIRSGFDLPVVNGQGDALGEGTRGLGGLLKTHSNRSRTAIYAGRIAVVFIISVFVLYHCFVGKHHGFNPPITCSP